VKVACWQDYRFGPAFVAVLPVQDGEPPETARIQRCPPGPARQLAGKGHSVSWQDWVQHLTERLPYEGRWSVEEVPDGRTARQALAHLRQQATLHGLTQANPEGTVGK
jgi:hypothetical protein